MSRKPQTHTGSVRLTAARTLAVAPLVATSLVAQVPSPVQPLPTRRVHETMAPTTSTTQLNGTSPLFQYPDGQWNHGEGFTTAGADEDQGGWFNEESGDGLTPSDIHTTRGWTSWTWTNPINPSSGAAIRNFVGYLRPNNNLPDTHPLYGQLGAGQGPFGNGTYVDQGAFEVFAPIAGPGPTQKIVVVINNWESTIFPKDHQGRVFPWNVYEGFFSPDGLVRRELPGTRSLANFLANTADAAVKRAAFAADAVATAPANGATYWPISAYAVCSMPGRQTTLNEQRNMQLRQAVLLMLQQPDARNPLYPAFLSAQDIEQRVVVVFIGGSNGGHQSMWAAMRHPDKVHGTYAEVINPSIQRLFGEHDLGFAYSRLAGLPEKGATVTEWDFMNWGRYTWNQGKWIHDISLLRRQARNQAYRPSCFRVADEDITSTGTDWVAVANQGAWLDHGQSPVSNPAGWGISSKLSWSVTRFACHDAGNQTVNPYTNTPTYYAQKVIHEVILAAIANRTAQLAAPTQPLVPAPIPSEDRPAGPAQLRGLDDPHEWALGRKGTAMATSNSLLAEDATWFNRVQPGAAGTWLGTKESILISAGRVYVVGAEGVVTAFAVDLTAGMRHRLVKVAQTHDANGRPKSLGLDACALAAGPGGTIVVGSRRHLFVLDNNLNELPGRSVELPWEVAQPHHMKFADVLPSSFNGGSELVFASVHGGLVFYSLGNGSGPPVPLYEWPEPGIVDFVISKTGTVAVLSNRGVVAEVDFSTVTNATSMPTLAAASRPIPRRLQEHVTSNDPDLDSPSQGQPLDIELMRCRLDGTVQEGIVATWTGDEDSYGTVAVRAYVPGTMVTKPFAAQLAAGPAGRGGTDMATCHTDTSLLNAISVEPPGDHLLVLYRDRLHLLDDSGAPVGEKILFLTNQFTGNAYVPFGRQANAIVVGDLIDNGLTGSTGPYAEEVVVATQSGALMWLHINDIAAAGSTLGSAYYLANAGGANSQIQPRTNQCMSSTWAMTQQAGDVAQLHLLDQRGGYWQVNGAGGVVLKDIQGEAVGARGWSDLGNRTATGTVIPPSVGSWPALRLELQSPLLGQGTKLQPNPWCPINPIVVAYEKAGTPYYFHDNWDRFRTTSLSWSGFVVHAWAGCVLDDPTNGREVWQWSSGGDWGNLVEGIRFPVPSSGPSWPVTALWASTNETTQSSPADRVGYLELRSTVTATPIMTHQAIQGFMLPDGRRAVVLGCPGGSVRILSLQPSDLGTPLSQAHSIGGSPIDIASTPDLGYGGGAMAVRQSVNGDLTIWFGTLYRPTPRPAAYATAGQGSLADSEVATGELHRLSWAVGGSAINLQSSLALAPGITSRGGYGVVGLCVANLIEEPSPQPQVDELVVTTLTGDVIVMDAATWLERWRTHVPGAAGFYNSIRVADLNGDAHKELYVSGSFGIWRFTQPGEVMVIQ